jgi:hypothetical protein
MGSSPLFNRPESAPPQRGFPVVAVSLAAVAALVLLGLLLLGSRHHMTAPGGVQPLAAYAPDLALSNVQMSESESLSGGKDTYIDGTIANHGAATVTAITVQVFFANDEQMPPQVETVPLQLIRTRQPYVDTEAVSAEPLKPGDSHDFRLIFENIGDNWNQAIPQIHVIAVTTR